MGTCAPVLPKGRVGTVACFSEAFNRPVIGAITEPTPATPAAFKNFRRDQLLSFVVIENSSNYISRFF
jgi:hypothetical protein